MIKTLMYHKVENFDKWKAAFDGFLEVRKAGGEIDFSVGTLHDEPHTAYAINSWKNIEAFQAFVGSDQLKEAMKQAGVLEAPHITIFNEVDKG